jgi:hypothetical protein
METTTSPEAETPSAKPAKIVTIHRFQIGLNVIIQALVVVGLVLAVNYLSFRHFKRWDFSRDRKYALSSQTTNVLKSLQKPVKAVVFFSSAAEIAPDVNNLLREYEYASNGKFKVEVVDPFRSLTRAQELQAQYKFGANENIVILDAGDAKSKFVNATDMADIEMPDQMAMMTGQTQPRIKAFKGEQAITSALLELTEGKANKIYYVTGDGEPDINAPEMRPFNDTLKRENIQISPLTLLNVSAIPDDARAIIICSPKSDLSEVPMKLLGDYWEKKGRIFVLLNPFVKAPHLTGWLNGLGIVPQEDRIIGTVKVLRADAQGNPQLATAVVSSPAFEVLDSHTPITKELERVSKQLLGPVESLKIDRSREQIAKVHIVPILQSTKEFWGATDFSGSEDKPAFFDPKRDHMGPLDIAAAVEKGGVEDQRVKMDSSRLFVIGNGELLTDKAYRLSEGVTLDLTVNVLNWLLDREAVIGIAPKEKKTLTISLDEKQLRSVAIGVMLIIPGIVALCGLIVWSQRRA